MANQPPTSWQDPNIGRNVPVGKTNAQAGLNGAAPTATLDASGRLVGAPTGYPQGGGGAAGGQGGPSFTMQQPQYADPGSAYNFGTPDYSQPGAAESMFASMGGNYQQPTNSQGYASNVLSHYGNGSQLPTDPGLGTYYNDAETRAGDKLRSELAAQGSYGSSYGQAQTANMFSGMEADRAKNEAGYNLARSADQRNWATALSGIAGQADNTNVNQWNSGMNAAGEAQNAQGNRFQNAFGDSLAVGDRLSGIMQHANDQAHGDYWHAFDAATGLSTAMGANGVADATYNGQQSRQNMNDFMNTAGNGFKAGSAIYNGMQQPGAPVPPVPQPSYYQTGPNTDTYNLPTQQY